MILRGKVLFWSLCGVGTLAALLGLGEMWLFFISWPEFLKIMGTLLILGTLLSFLIAVDYDFPASRRRLLLLGIIALSVLGSLLSILQIWFQPLEWSFFLKILASHGIAIALLAFLSVAAEDFDTHKRLKDNDFID